MKESPVTMLIYSMTISGRTPHVRIPTCIPMRLTTSKRSRFEPSMQCTCSHM